MVLRPLAATVEHRLAHQLNAYRQGPNEFPTSTRNLLQLGGTTATPSPCTSTDPPPPRITRAFTLFTDQLNPNPPHISGDPRPVPITTP